MLDFNSFCQELHIETCDTDHKHTREGWTQVRCPFCSGHDGWHLGYEHATGRFTCWRCGWHHPIEVLQTLADATKNQAYALLRKYKQRASERQQVAAVRYSSKCVLPLGSEAMTKRHKRYLEERDFDADKLAAEYGLLGTGPIGLFKHRVVIPIYLNGELISYQARDITGHSDLRYRTCRLEDSVYNLKHSLYNIDRATSESVVVVEGVTSIWRLGYNSVATYGIKFTIQQVQMLRQFKRVFVFFDPNESQARLQARKLADALSMFCDVEILDIDADIDPAELEQEDADALMKELFS